MSSERLIKIFVLILFKISRYQQQIHYSEMFYEHPQDTLLQQWMACFFYHLTAIVMSYSPHHIQFLVRHLRMSVVTRSHRPHCVWRGIRLQLRASMALCVDTKSATPLLMKTQMLITHLRLLLMLKHIELTSVICIYGPSIRSGWPLSPK